MINEETKPPRQFTPEEITFIRKDMGLPVDKFAEFVGVAEYEVQGWESGLLEIPDMMDKLLEMIQQRGPRKFLFEHLAYSATRIDSSEMPGSLLSNARDYLRPNPCSKCQSTQFDLRWNGVAGWVECNNCKKKSSPISLPTGKNGNRAVIEQWNKENSIKERNV